LGLPPEALPSELIFRIHLVTQFADRYETM
jgi:hypothetical protein